ncbi:MAG: TetR/AcrR family transcriptional regulator [Nocardiaceae bacterium]|nr:TetR/AcrR family transcriptional regulator [Nocardiaceae bacterium]
MRREVTPGANRSPTGPGRIKEALHNDVAVLRAAREVFAEQGWEAPVSAIATRAGVGVGSIYRRYRTKEELAQSLRVWAIDHLTDLVRDCVDRFDPDQRLLAVFFRRLLGESDGPLLASLGGKLPRHNEVDRAIGELLAALEALIALAREHSQLPADFTSADIMLMSVHLRPSLPTDPKRATELHERYLDFMLDGIEHAYRTGGLDTAPTWAEWYRMWQPE